MCAVDSFFLSFCLYLPAITIFEEFEQLIESLYHHVSTIAIEIFNFDISHVRGFSSSFRGREPSIGTSKKALPLLLSKYLTEDSNLSRCKSSPERHAPFANRSRPSNADAFPPGTFRARNEAKKGRRGRNAGKCDIRRKLPRNKGSLPRDRARAIRAR